MNISPDLQFNIADQTNARVGLLGKSGSGKSNTSRVYVEEIVRSGQPIAMTIIDPEDEYWSLKQIGDFIVVGEDEHADVPCDTSHAAALARFSVEQAVSVILSLSHLDDAAADEFLAAYLTGLWKAQIRKRRPYLLAVEEAHEFASQKKPSESKPILIRMAKRGRKKGLMMLFATQRPADLDKGIVTQLNTLFLHRVTYPTDMAVYKEVVPLKPADTEKLVQGLVVGQAIVVRDGEHVEVAQIRKATTYDAGATPGLEAAIEPTLHQNRDVIADLKNLLAAAPPPEDPELLALRRQSGELQDALSEKNAALDASALVIEQQQTEIEALRVQIDAIRSNGHANGGSIERMEVGAIHADQIVTGGEAYLAPPQAIGRDHADRDTSAASAASDPAPDRAQSLLDLVARREQQNSERAISRERKAFSTMLTHIQQRTRPAWLSVYGYLMLYEGKHFNVDDLCRILSYQYKTLSDLPNELINQGLLHRAGRGQKSVYWSTAREALGQLYPALDVDDMFHWLLDAVSPKKGK